MTSGIRINCKIIPGIASINPPEMKAVSVKASPLTHNSISFATPQTILPPIIDVTRETYDIISRNGNIKNHILEYNNGGHFTEPDLRTAKGFAWLINNQ